MRRMSSFLFVASSTLAILATATGAHAATIYPPSNACQASASAADPGQPIDFSCEAGTFGANETVTITVTGENGADATFSMVRLAVTTGSATRTSSDTGALAPVVITLPPNATGVYNIEAISATSVGGTSSTSIRQDGIGLIPNTGGDSGSLALWVGGGAILVGGGVALAVAARRRRDDS